ncbi:hypothetical protein [Granulicella sp. L60]|uniref:hypothetical protein n=1 Tax=Granulicella sp. L60 TaxID=1641866 RepID=UPI00131A7CBC|nr:hypothetical protein [Granulicella sp. L60]
MPASADVAPNKFLAKITSDWKKPNGHFVIEPHEVQDLFLTPPVRRIRCVGKVMEARMGQVGIAAVEGAVHDVVNRMSNAMTLLA